MEVIETCSDLKEVQNPESNVPVTFDELVWIHNEMA